MNKKWIKKTGLLFSSLAFVGCIGGVLAYKMTPAVADGAEALLRSSYEFGETVSVPKAELEFNGETVLSNDFVVYLPDGSAIKRERFEAEDYGKYTVRYYASVSGRTVYADKTFTVQNTICTASQEGTTYTYGVNEEYQTKKGLSLSIKAGDEVKINKLVDLSEANFQTSFVNFQFTPVNYGIADAYRVYMKLTDAYDENNYVIVRMQNWSDMGNWADGTCYIDAKAPNQEWTSSVEKTADHHKRGEEGKGWFGSYTSMTGRNAEGKREYNILNVFYDQANKRLNASGNYQGASMIVDLDDPEWYDLSKETLWKGFTTGECYVSFYGDRYNSSSLNLHITKLLGHDLSQSDADEDAPVITVDYGAEEPSALPYALLGNEYKIFSATARDLTDGEVKTIANVYYDYDGNRCIVDSANGAFRPTKEGEYTIVYSATDKTGNTAYKTVCVECKATAEKFTVSVQGAVQSCLAGETVNLFESLNISGNNGNAEITVSVLQGGKETRIDLDSPTFTPLEAEDFTVKVVAKDYVSQTEASYTVEVNENPFPVFTKTAVLPKYFIKGATYTFGGNEAVVYGGEMKKAEVKTFVSENGGARTEINGRYTPTAEGNAEIVFEAKNGENVTPISVTVPVIDVGYCSDYFDISAYFQDSTGKVVTNVTEDYLEVCASEEGSIHFINAVQADSLEMTLNVNKNYQAFNRFYVLLTDSENEKIQLKASYERAGDKITMYLNDNFSVIKTLPSNFDESSTSNILCNYTASNKNLYGFNDVWYTVEKDLQGNAFNGFPSGKVYLTVGFEEITGESRVKIMNINNQTLYALSRDSAKPQIIADSSIGSLRIGETVTLMPATYIDVLDPTVSCAMEVVDPNGKYAVATDGTKLDATCDVTKAYAITVDTYGDYSVVYSCKDSTNSRETLYAFTFSVKDFIAPEVSFVNPTTEVARGASVKIANVQVSDNYSETVSTYFCVRDPKGTVTAVGENKEFVADTVGTYTVFCYAFDEEGNSTFVSYDVKVR